MASVSIAAGKQLPLVFYLADGGGEDDHFVRLLIETPNGEEILPPTPMVDAGGGVFRLTGITMPEDYESIVVRYEVYEDDEYTVRSSSYSGDQDVFIRDDQFNILNTQVEQLVDELATSSRDVLVQASLQNSVALVARRRT